MNKRIDFIDLAKGVCILLVVIGHCGCAISLPGTQNMRMPLYFILSGLFFKDYGGFKQFLFKKTNRILIPFLFFYLIGYVVFYIIYLFAPDVLKTEANGIFDVFTQRQYFNGPIWFLICLFWSNLFFCMISLSVKREWVRFIIVMSLGIVGIILGLKFIMLPCMLDVALTALPFFYFGYILKKTPLLYKNKYDKFNLIFAVLLFVVAYFMTIWSGFSYIGFHSNHIVGNVPAIFISSITSVMSILYLCKIIGRLPFLSYFGRYSIIPLCVHHLIYRPVKFVMMHFGMDNVLVLSVITVLLSWACIPLCIKYIPYFTAQKDLIKIAEANSNSDSLKNV